MKLGTKKLKCDKPYDLDEARKQKGLPRRRRKDSRTTAYELTIRVPKDYRRYFNGKRKLTRMVYALNKKDDLKSQVESFEVEKNAHLERCLEERESKRADAPKDEDEFCKTPIGDYAERYVDIRSNGSVSSQTTTNERRYLKYVNASIGHIPICEVSAENIEECLLNVPKLSEQWALERRTQQEENRKTVRWAKKHGSLVKPLKPIKVAGPDMQAKVLKFLREVMNYALEKEDIVKNTAKAKFLTRLFKKSKPLIDPLMEDEAARFLQEVEKLALGYFKLSLLLLLNTGMRPEEMLAIRTGNIIFGENETVIKITSVLDRDGTIREYPKSDASRRSVPVDGYTADVAREWINSKSKVFKEMGLKTTMSMLLMGPDTRIWPYENWYKEWCKFVEAVGFVGTRPYALRHTFATLNLANGENIKTISVLLGHASPSYTLDLYAGYVPNTGMGIGTRYMNYLRRAA